MLRPLFTYISTCVYVSFDLNHDTSRVTCVPASVLSPLISLLEFCLLCMFMYIFTGVFTYVYACFDLRLVIFRGTAFLTPFCNSSFVIGISFIVYVYVNVNSFTYVPIFPSRYECYELLPVLLRSVQCFLFFVLL